jgi:hypothetical protein
MNHPGLPSARRQALDQFAFHQLAVGIATQGIDNEDLSRLLVGVQLG